VEAEAALVIAECQFLKRPYSPTMRMKLDRNFLAINVDEGDELFPNGIFEFNITKLLEHIKTNPHSFPKEEVAVSTLEGWSSTNLDETTIQNADLAAPIVLAEIRPNRFNVIDGNHRVARARRDDVKTIPAYRLSPDQHHRFLTSAFAYEKYVEYWNSKLDRE
jgi:hypothetical protein